jgi:peptidoglycan L-alanyl-D-glutamate endopeptidase CwlK
MTDKLAGVHPQLKERVTRLTAALGILGFPMIVTDGVRSTEEQIALYAQGRNLPGLMVTNADGVIRRSNHQLHADGCGHAVDCTFLGPNGQPRWVDSDPWPVYGACAKALGLVWGGDWGGTKPGLRADRPHVELPDGIPNTGASHALAAEP